MKKIDKIMQSSLLWDAVIIIAICIVLFLLLDGALTVTKTENVTVTQKIYREAVNFSGETFKVRVINKNGRNFNCYTPSFQYKKIQKNQEVNVTIVKSKMSGRIICKSVND